ncbi:hypothetical protein [Dysosmobacter sp.]|uniref:hypothetical protein n=1 Tax=Dysosmobacter sp. TaxID=2591382 RepID=UPI003A935FC6
MDRLNARHLALLGILTAVLLGGQVALAALPNVEIVSLLVILYSLLLGRQVFLIIYAFALLEGCLYGFGLWWVSYLYVWTLLAIIALALRQAEALALFWAILSGFFGLAFGALCALPYLVTGGIAAAISYWLAGLGFDLIHCAGNFLVCLLLFRPLYRLLSRLLRWYGWE